MSGILINVCIDEEEEVTAQHSECNLMLSFILFMIYYVLVLSLVDIF